MRSSYVICAALLAAGLPAAGQNWEVGAGGGFGFYTNKTVTAGSLSGETGFERGFAAGGWLGNDISEYFGGEFRYTYRKNDLKLSSGSTKVTFTGDSHIIHYDFLIYAARRGSKVRPFAAVGGGIKVYRGTGATQAVQPLSNLALLSPVTETKGLGSVGGGVKFQIAPGVVLRVEVRDFITPFPKQVIVPSIGASVSGIIHDIVPMVGISAVF